MPAAATVVWAASTDSPRPRQHHPIQMEVKRMSLSSLRPARQHLEAISYLHVDSTLVGVSALHAGC